MVAPHPVSGAAARTTTGAGPGLFCEGREGGVGAADETLVLAVQDAPSQARFTVGRVGPVTGGSCEGDTTSDADVMGSPGATAADGPRSARWPVQSWAGAPWTGAPSAAVPFAGVARIDDEACATGSTPVLAVPDLE